MFSTTKLYVSAINVVAKNEENSTKAELSAKLKPKSLEGDQQKRTKRCFLRINHEMLFFRNLRWL